MAISGGPICFSELMRPMIIYWNWYTFALKNKNLSVKVEIILWNGNHFLQLNTSTGLYLFDNLIYKLFTYSDVDAARPKICIPPITIKTTLSEKILSLLSKDFAVLALIILRQNNHVLMLFSQIRCSCCHNHNSIDVFKTSQLKYWPRRFPRSLHLQTLCHLDPQCGSSHHHHSHRPDLLHALITDKNR